jgi:uncharacterized protein
MSSFPGLVFSEREGKLVASTQPAPDRPPLDSQTLHGLLKQAGYGNWFLLEGALATLVARCNAGAAELDMTVGERRDGSFTLEIAKDASCAWVNLVPAMGGKAVTSQDILNALAEAGVVFGIDEAALRQVCDSAVPARIVAASGMAAQKGVETQFEMLLDLARNRAPKIDGQGLIDFRELGDIPMIEAGVALMRRVPATRGVDGRDVRGTVQPATPGRDLPFASKMIGVAVAVDDPNLLRATVKGMPVCLGNGASVEQILSVKNVNMASGNISFDGSVQVEGDVLAGMKIHASGDIIVDGVVEGAELVTDGNVQVGAGIIAHAEVRAGGSVSARFVENSQIYAGTVIAIDDMALQSDLQALNQILIGQKSPQRGRLVGGSARAMMQIQTPLLGAATSGVTAVQLGVNPVLEARHQELLQLIEKQDAEQENLKKVVKHLVQQADKKELFERAKASWTHAVQAWAHSLQEKDELEKQLSLIKGARLEVGLGVAGAVDLVFGKQTRHIRKTFDAGVFSTDEADRIVFTDPGGRSAVVT